jgi:hypothetical protein
MSHFYSSLSIFELLQTKLHYEVRLKNVSNTFKNRYKGNFTMKIDYFFTGGRRLNQCQRLAQNQIQNHKKKMWDSI